tara:strand:- start:8235 stop:9092 length:858 start_codon:yes stop_codon:yes gene_type:complete
MIYKNILILIILSLLTGCGSNIFETFDDNENTTANLLNQLEYAETDEDYDKIIANTNLIINDPSSTNAEKGAAQLIQSEAIITKAGVTTIDMMGNIGTAVDNPDISNFNALNVNANQKDALIKAAKQIENAESNGVNPTEDQHLTKGVTNIAVAKATIDESLIINDDGTVTRKDETKSFFQSLETAMYPDPTDTTKTTSDYATSGIDGLTNSNSFTTSQNDEMNDVKTDIVKAQDLHTAAKNGTTYTKTDGTEVTFSGNFNSDGDLVDETEQNVIEQELSSIFRN